MKDPSYQDGKTGFGEGNQEHSHIKFEILLRHPYVDVQQAVGYLSLEFKRSQGCWRINVGGCWRVNVGTQELKILFKVSEWMQLSRDWMQVEVKTGVLRYLKAGKRGRSLTLLATLCRKASLTLQAKFCPSQLIPNHPALFTPCTICMRPLKVPLQTVSFQRRETLSCLLLYHQHLVQYLAHTSVQ